MAAMRIALLSVFLALAASCSTPGVFKMPASKGRASLLNSEPMLMNPRQVVSGGTSTLPRWSFDGNWISFQHHGPGLPLDLVSAPTCDQVFAVSTDGQEIKRVSTAAGLNAGAGFYPDGVRALFSSTAIPTSRSPEARGCPPLPDTSKGPARPVYNSFQLYSVRAEDTDPLQVEPGAPRAYNSEAAVCEDGSVVFTSDREGDLELYVGKLERLGTLSDVKRVTNVPGYDGGASFSRDCKKLVWHASRPGPGKETEDSKKLLKQRLRKPTKTEIWIANVNGSDARALTKLGANSVWPVFTPDSKAVVFAADLHDHQFDLHLIGVDGSGLERVSTSSALDSYPAFSPDGRKLAFASGREAASPGDLSIFVTDWAPTR